MTIGAYGGIVSRDTIVSIMSLKLLAKAMMLPGQRSVTVLLAPGVNAL